MANIVLNPSKGTGDSGVNIYFEPANSRKMEKLVKKQQELIAAQRRTIEIDNELLGSYKKVVKLQEEQLKDVYDLVTTLQEKIEAAE